MISIAVMLSSMSGAGIPSTVPKHKVQDSNLVDTAVTEFCNSFLLLLFLDAYITYSENPVESLEISFYLLLFISYKWDLFFIYKIFFTTSLVIENASFFTLKIKYVQINFFK